MMVESKIEEEIINNEIIEKYFRNKHVLLIYLAGTEAIGKETTVIDIKAAFKITKKYAWTLLEGLEKDRLIVKGEKVAVEGVEYHSYILTMIAKQDLKVISLCLSKYGTYCPISKSSECPYSNEFPMKMTPEKNSSVKNKT